MKCAFCSKTFHKDELVTYLPPYYFHNKKEIVKWHKPAGIIMWMRKLFGMSYKCYNGDWYNR